MTTADLSLWWQRHQRMFFFSAMVVLLSYGPELFDFTFATDYYYSELLRYPGSFGSDGRWLGAFFYYIVLGGKSNPYLFKLLFFASQFIIVALIADLFGITRNLHRTIVFAILAIHPYLLSLHSFNYALPLYALGNLLSVLGVYLILKHQSPVAFASSVVAIAGALASWQIGLNYGAVLFLFFLIYLILSESGFSVRRTAYYTAVFSVAHALGYALYLLGTEIHIRIGLINPVRMMEHGRFLASWEQVKLKALHLELVMRDYLLKTQDYFPLAAKVLMLLSLLVLFLAAAIWLRRRSRALIEPLLILLLLVLAFFAAVGVMLPLRHYETSYRLFYGFGMFNALVFAVFFSRLERSQNANYAMVGIGLALAAIFVYQTNIAHMRMAMKNRYEWSVGFAISEEIRALPAFRQNLPLAIIGTHGPYFTRVFRVHDDRKGRSQTGFRPTEILVHDWAKERMFYPFFSFVAPNREQRTQAEAHARGMTDWPRPGSVDIHEGMIIVKLGTGRSEP